MDAITNEVDRALTNGLYYLAVMLAISLPDICAALESADGQTTQAKYVAWYDAWLASQFQYLTGPDLYRLRCAVVHQGRFGHPGMQYSRVLFTLPNTPRHVYHDNIMDDALNLDVVTFCRDVLDGVSRWYDAKKQDPNVLRNLPQLVQFRPHGLAPYTTTVPLIA